MSGIQRVGIVGGGVMGTGIAEVCGRAGLDVLVAVSSPRSLEPGRQRLLRSVAQGVRKERLTEADGRAILDAVAFTTELADLADRQIVIESIPEVEPSKLAVFTALDEIVKDPDGLLASNTSSLPIVRLARATNRAERVVGLHFFNPAPVMALVEVTGSVLTASEAHARAMSFVGETLGKEVIASPDRAGFVVNNLLVPYLIGAIRMLESGHADAETIDRGMVQGCAHPTGPIRLADAVGLDVLLAAADALYLEYKEPAYVAPPLLRRMVDAGLLGRKSARGFYRYA